MKKENLTQASLISLVIVILSLMCYTTSLINPKFDLSTCLQTIAGGLLGLGFSCCIILFYERKMKKKKCVFITYDQNDREFALALSNYLSINKTIVYDENQIVRIGDSFNENLKESIVNSDSFIVVLSENLVFSDFLKKEISLAEEGNKKIIPVIKDNTAIPSFLSNYKPANFKRSHNGSFEFQQLLGAI